MCHKKPPGGWSAKFCNFCPQSKILAHYCNCLEDVLGWPYGDTHDVVQNRPRQTRCCDERRSFCGWESPLTSATMTSSYTYTGVQESSLLFIRFSCKGCEVIFLNLDRCGAVKTLSFQNKIHSVVHETAISMRVRPCIRSRLGAEWPYRRA